ncbi:hypothetical protein CsatB_024215 [Cannabis sativa]
MENKKQEERSSEKKTVNDNIINDDDDKRKSEKLEGLAMEDSPYLQYKDLEDYKMKAYGAQGHLEPVAGRGAGASTDAPTSQTNHNKASATDTINRLGVL